MTTTLIAVRLPPALLAVVDDAARRGGITRSALVREALLEKCDRPGERPGRREDDERVEGDVAGVERTDDCGAEDHQPDPAAEASA